VGFDVLTAVLLKFLVFWDVTRCWGEDWCELEAWFLTLTEENILMISENRVLRGIFDLAGWKWQEGG
jgi:hypothetical protein